MPTINGTSGNDTLTGTSEPDIINGLAGEDQLSGLEGNDQLNGGDHADTMDGGAGNDLFVGGGGIRFEGIFSIGDTYIGGTGRDTFVVSQDIDRITENVGEGDDVVLALADYRLRPGVEVETMVAAEGSLPIALTGNEFAQSIYGNAGTNVIVGGGGADYLVGGGGSDIYYIGSSSTIIEETGSDEDLVRTTTSSFTLSANLEGLEASWSDFAGTTDPLSLTGNDLANRIVGNRGDNLIRGGAGNDILYGVYLNAPPLADGNDVLNGGLGADQMYGGQGNDVYIVDNSGDAVFEKSGEGDDIISTFVNYALASSQEVETLAAQDSAGSISLEGNGFNNSLYGNASANRLNGGGGSDYLVGLGGNDLLIGFQGGDALELGADNLAGGTGSDSYYVDWSDRIFENAGEGDDLAVAFTSFALEAGQSVETIAAVDSAGAASLSGNELAQSLYGNTSANVLNGGGANDYLVGGSGADRFAFTGAPGNDAIGDFASGTDKIDLSAYGITAAQVSSSASGGNTLLSIDSNKDGTADFTINLIGSGPPASGDFIF